MLCATFGGSRAAALIWIMPFWHPLGNDLCRCSISGLQKQCTTPCPRSSKAGEVPSRNTSPCDVVPHVAACGPHQRSSQILFVSQKRLFQQYLLTADSYLLQLPTRASAPPSEAQPQIGRGRPSEAETQSDRGIDVAVLEEAEAQPAMHLVEH